MTPPRRTRSSRGGEVGNGRAGTPPTSNRRGHVDTPSYGNEEGPPPPSVLSRVVSYTRVIGPPGDGRGGSATPVQALGRSAKVPLRGGRDAL